MTERPAFMKLTLRNPPMQNGTIRWLQQQLNRSKYVFPKLETDGVFGPHTAHEVKQLLFRLGHPNPTHALSKKDLGHVWDWSIKGGQALPSAWRTRAKARKAAGYSKLIGFTARSWAGLHPKPEGRIRVYTRAELGLVAPIRTTASNAADGRNIVVHWQGPGSGALGLVAARSQWQSWQRYHMSKGWNDIGYNFGIPRGCPVGTVFEGRGAGVYGAHSGHPTANSRIGVVLMYGENDVTPTADQLATLELFCNANHTTGITGHWEWSPTSCPGTAAKGWVYSNRRGVN